MKDINYIKNQKVFLYLKNSLTVKSFYLTVRTKH